MSNLIYRDEIETVKLSKKYCTGAKSLSRLTEEKNKYQKENDFYQKKVKLHTKLFNIVKFFYISFWSIFIISAILFILFHFRQIGKILPFDREDIIVLCFMISLFSIIPIVSFKKLYEKEREKLDGFDYRFKDYSKNLAKYLEKIQIVSNRPDAEVINKEIKEIEVLGRNYYDMYLNSEEITDLEASVKMGNPMAIIKLVALHLIPNELKCANWSYGINALSKSNNVQCAYDLCEYCLDVSESYKDFYWWLDDYRFNEDYFYAPYKKEFSIVEKSASYISNLIHLRQKKDDIPTWSNTEPDICNTIRSLIAYAINSGKVLSFLLESMNSYARSEPKLSESDILRINRRVQEQFNPTYNTSQNGSDDDDYYTWKSMMDNNFANGM